MPVIERPGLAANPVGPGTLVAIRIDPLASIASMDDAEATQAAAALQPCKVLAVYDSAINPEYSAALGGLVMNVFLRLVGQGLLAPPRSVAAVPISNAPVLPENGRASLQTSPRFPRDDCYLYTLETLTATVSRIYQESLSGYAISEKDIRAYRLAVIRDNRAFASSYRPSQHADDGADADDRTDADDGTDGIADSDEDASESLPVSRSDSASEGPGLADILFHEDNVPQMKLHVEMWLDVSPDDAFGTPDDVGRIVAQLEQIERDWAKRRVADIMSKRPQTTAWLAGVSDGNNFDPQPPAEPEYHGEYDDLVQPEDAVEHRLAMEQESAPLAAHSDAGKGSRSSVVPVSRRSIIPEVAAKPAEKQDDAPAVDAAEDPVSGNGKQLVQDPPHTAAVPEKTEVRLATGHDLPIVHEPRPTAASGSGKLELPVVTESDPPLVHDPPGSTSARNGDTKPVVDDSARAPQPQSKTSKRRRYSTAFAWLRARISSIVSRLFRKVRSPTV